MGERSFPRQRLSIGEPGYTLAKVVAEKVECTAKLLLSGGRAS
jgi:hypothetical protein